MLALLSLWLRRLRERRDLARMAALGRHDILWRDLALSDLELKREINKPFWRA